MSDNFKITNEVYQYKQYEIRVLKVYSTNQWCCYIIDTEKGERIYSGGGYVNSRNALNSAKEYFVDKEKPKFKQGDVLIRNDICGSNKYIVLMRDIDTQKAYRMCVIAGDNSYEILNWAKEVTERDFTKVDEV